MIDVHYDPAGRRVIRLRTEDHDWNSWNIAFDDSGAGGICWRTCSTCDIVEQRTRARHSTEFRWIPGERIMEPIA